MSYTKDYRAYPPAFEELIRVAAVREVVIPCADAKDAKRLEGKLHAFFGVLHRQALKIPKDAEDYALVLELDRTSRRVKIKATEANLVAIPRDLEPDNALILGALGLTSSAGSSPAGVNISPEMAEFMAQTLTNPD